MSISSAPITAARRVNSTPAPQPQDPVNNAVEQFLLKLNRIKFGSCGEQSVTLQVAIDALTIFEVMLRSERPRPVSRIIKKMYSICLQYFSRAPAFRVVLANVTRMAIRAVREASAAAQSLADDTEDLSALDQAPTADAVFENDPSDDDAKSSPRGHTSAAPHRTVTFDVAQGHFPDVEDGAREEQDALNSSFEQQPATPVTEATIKRIPSCVSVARPRRRIAYKEFSSAALCALADLRKDVLAEMVNDLCEHAKDHVADGDTLLTYGSSHTQVHFFKAAAEAGKKFTLIVLAAEPHGNTSPLVSALRPYGVRVEVLADSECFNALSRVCKVFLSADSILANGGLLAPTGSMMVCLCAKVYSAEVVVLCNTIKISPYYPSDSQCSSLVKMNATEAKEMLWTSFSQPAKVLPPEHVHSVSMEADGGPPLVFNPVLEYVAPEYVSLFVTDKGEFTTSYIYRFLKDAYSAEDTHL